MPKPGSDKAEALRKRLDLSYEHLVGIRFAVNVTVGGAVVWSVLRYIFDTEGIWAIASMIAASDPRPEEAHRMFRARLINACVGCASGLAFLLIAGTGDWVIPVALGVTVLVSSNVVRVTKMWRQAPITAAIILAAGAMQESTAAGIRDGLQKVAEVAFGSLVGVMVSWLMSRVWLIELPPKED
jgi:hypothetical protein